MRLLILFLVLVNVGWYYYWSEYVPVPQQTQIAPADTGVEPLQFLEEIAKRPGAAKRTAELTPTCYELGPIMAKAQVDQIAARLSDIGVGAGESRRAPGQDTMYHVVIAPLGSEEAVQQISSQLAAGGIANFSILRNNGQSLGILLGVYTDAGAAAQRREQVAALGYSPRVEIQAPGAEQYWLEVHVYGQPERLAALMQSWPSLRLESRSCE